MDTTIGLRDLYCAHITSSTPGADETYGTPAKLAPIINASITPEYDEAKLYADDKVEDLIKEMTGGKIKLDVTEITDTEIAYLLGLTYQLADGYVYYTRDDSPAPVAIGFRAKTSKGKFRYVWLYRVLFSAPSMEFSTKGDSIKYNSPTLEGEFLPRIKADANGKHPVMVTANWDEEDSSDWFNAVVEPYEPTQSNPGH